MSKAFGEQARSFLIALRLLLGNRVLVGQEDVDKLDNNLGNIPRDKPVDVGLILGEALQSLPDGRFIVDLRSLDKLTHKMGDTDGLMIQGFRHHIGKAKAKQTNTEVIRAIAQIMVSVLLVGFGVFVLMAIDDADTRMAATAWIGMVGGYWLR